MEENFKGKGDECCSHHGKCKGFIGIGLLIIGLIFLAKDLGYIPGISFWTILFIVGGIFMMLKMLMLHKK
ncbi:MAG: hypothetical protein V3U72_00895 [Candidatus Aenigmarchaeota archaeon]